MHWDGFTHTLHDNPRSWWISNSQDQTSNLTNKGPAAQYDGLGFSKVKLETVVSSELSNNPDFVSNQVNAVVQVWGQTAKVDLHIICENHVLGMFEGRTDVIDE